MIWLALAVLAVEELAIWLIVRKTLGPIDWKKLNEPTDLATLLAQSWYR